MLEEIMYSLPSANGPPCDNMNGYGDMPHLLCGACDFIWSPGGHDYRQHYPLTLQNVCLCEVENTRSPAYRLLTIRPSSP